MSETAPEPLYLTARQVADLVRVDEKTVLRWSLQDASMPVLRRGRVVRFPARAPARLARAPGATRGPAAAQAGRRVAPRFQKLSPAL